jgi:hypothetical protein
LEVFPQQRGKGAPGAAFLNEGGKAKTGMKELLYKNSIFSGWSSKQFLFKKINGEWSIQYNGLKTPNRVVSLLSLCSVVGRRREKGMSIGYKGVELRETIQWIFEALKLLKES